MQDMTEEYTKDFELHFRADGPVCVKHPDCFANKKGRCAILENNYFGNRQCPFYKKNRTD